MGFRIVNKERLNFMEMEFNLCEILLIYLNKITIIFRLCKNSLLVVSILQIKENHNQNNNIVSMIRKKILIKEICL